MASTPLPRPPADVVGEGRRVAAFLDGEPAAVSEVRGWVRLAALPYRDLWRGELEDLEQEALLAVLEGLRSGRFRGDGPLRAYVRSMVHYHCIDRLRHVRRRTMESLDGLEIAADEEPAPARLLRAEEMQLALRVQARMPRGCQELWDLVRRLELRADGGAAGGRRGSVARPRPALPAPGPRAARRARRLGGWA